MQDNILTSLTNIITKLNDRYEEYEGAAIGEVVQTLLQSIEENIDKINVFTIDSTDTIQRLYSPILLDNINPTDKFVRGILLYKVDDNTQVKEDIETLSDIKSMCSKIKTQRISSIVSDITKLMNDLWVIDSWVEILYIYEFVDIHNKVYWKLKISGIDYTITLHNVDMSLAQISDIASKAFFWDGYVEAESEGKQYKRQLAKLISFLQAEKKLHV